MSWEAAGENFIDRIHSAFDELKFTLKFGKIDGYKFHVWGMNQGRICMGRERDGGCNWGDKYFILGFWGTDWLKMWCWKWERVYTSPCIWSHECRCFTSKDKFQIKEWELREEVWRVCERKETREGKHLRTYPGGFELQNYMKPAWRRREENSRTAIAQAGLDTPLREPNAKWKCEVICLKGTIKNVPLKVLKYKAFPFLLVVSFLSFHSTFLLSV